MENIKLFDKENISKLVKRLAHEIVEKNQKLDTLAIVGIRTRGDIIAKRIVELINAIKSDNVKAGTLDVTFYRDDFLSNWGSPRVGPSDIVFDVNKMNIILIDDVLYTGRTVKAAIEEIFSFGRPASIQLGVLVDRGHRELPIKANFVGKNIPTSNNEHVHVFVDEIDDKEEICLMRY
tara:strand:+ start:692 stop:1225 length:534 start_codon:yes stop_codon:yes gene_type:complete